MSIDGALGAIQSITTTIGGAANLAARVGIDIGGATPGAGSSWLAQLRPASYRGVLFGVLSSTGKFGRRNAVHEYPFRDTTWVEDLGKAARRISIAGFLVGDDIINQRERLIAAIETPGDGELIHPTLGRLAVSNIDLSTEERWDRGRVFEITLSFIEAGQRLFPIVETSTGDAVTAACKAADGACKVDFISATAASLKQGAAVVAQAVGTAAAWGRQAQRLANDATNLHHMAGTLSGSFGRYAKGGGGGGIAAAAGAANSVAELIALGSVARAAVSSAVSGLSNIASGLGL